LGVKLRQGTYKQIETTWLRWCDAKGNWVPTGAERIAQLTAQLRTSGIEPKACPVHDGRKFLACDALLSSPARENFSLKASHRPRRAVESFTPRFS
jgi:hypothetical protein